MKIAIVGLGYAGLPLCLQFAPSGVTVVGLDNHNPNQKVTRCLEKSACGFELAKHP